MKMIIETISKILTELRRREIDHEQRMQRGAMTFGGGYSRGGGDAPMIPRDPMGQQDGLEDEDSANGGALGFDLGFGSIKIHIQQLVLRVLLDFMNGNSSRCFALFLCSS